LSSIGRTRLVDGVAGFFSGFGLAFGAAYLSLAIAREAPMRHTRGAIDVDA